MNARTLHKGFTQFLYKGKNVSLWLKIEDTMISLKILDTQNFKGVPFWAPKFKVLAKTMTLNTSTPPKCSIYSPSMPPREENFQRKSHRVKLINTGSH